MTGSWVPRVSRGRRASRRSRDDDAARLPGNDEAAGAAAGLGPAATAMPAGSPRGDCPGWDADQAVAALYHAHYRSLARVAALLAGDVAKAEGIVQDAFVSMYRARRLPDGDKALGCLRRGVVTRARSRSAASRDQRSCWPRGLSAAGQQASCSPGPLLMDALGGLPARQREALVLKYYADWTDPQIAAAMGQRARAERPYTPRHLRPPGPPGSRLGGGP